MNEFDQKLTEYLEFLKADYKGFHSTGLNSTDEIKANVSHEMVERFNSTLHTERGSKYLKVVIRDGAHSFIVVKPDTKFQIGDILKPASWAAPTRNFRRGNILNNDYKTARWSGVS